MKKLFALSAALLLSLGALGSASADDPEPGPCEDTCSYWEPFQYCICPEWTDRPGEQSACGNWEIAGGCWYE